jgi:hypothetical protein
VIDTVQTTRTSVRNAIVLRALAGIVARSAQGAEQGLTLRVAGTKRGALGGLFETSGRPGRLTFCRSVRLRDANRSSLTADRCHDPPGGDSTLVSILLSIPAAALIVFVGLSFFLLFAFVVSAVAHLFGPAIQYRQHLVRAAWRAACQDALNRRRTIGRTSHRATTPGLVALLGVALMAIFLGNLLSGVAWLAYKLGTKLVHGPRPEEAPAYRLWVCAMIALLYLVDAVRYAVHPVAGWRASSDLPRVPLDSRHVSKTSGKRGEPQAGVRPAPAQHHNKSSQTRPAPPTACLRFPPNSGQVVKQLSLRLSGTARSKQD